MSRKRGPGFAWRKSRNRGIHRASDFLRCSWQVRTIPTARLVARRNGGSHPGQRTDPRGHNGRRGCVSRRTRLSAVFVRRDQRCDVLAHCRCLDWSNYSAHGCAHRDRAARHQAHPSLLNRVAARFDDGLVRRRRRGGWNHAFTRARFFQSASVSRLWLGDSRMPWRTGHSQNGRPATPDAGDVWNVRHRYDGVEWRPALLLRWLDQGGNSSRHRALAAIECTVLPDACRRRSHGALYDPANDLRLFRESPERRRARARKSACDDDAADCAGDWRSFPERRAHYRLAMAAWLSDGLTGSFRHCTPDSAHAFHFAPARRQWNRAGYLVLSQSWRAESRSTR